jgi:hypothetical protein
VAALGDNSEEGAGLAPTLRHYSSGALPRLLTMHLLRQNPLPLAGDRFDSDCVVGTQFESSQAHH